MTAITAPSAPAEQKTFSPESLRVLLFEDSAMDAALIKRFLQTTGVRPTNIFHTDTIPSALQVLTRENVDLCLTDYFLRPHTGFDLMDEARRFDFDVPFIVLTGMDDRNVDDGALERGAYDFLIKGDLTVEGLERSMRYTLTRHRHEAKLAKAAIYDPLTSLLNRTAFLERFEKVINDNRQRSASVALLHLNLNGSKALNESRGHKAGDAVLKAVGGKLANVKRPSDVVARLGADDFAMIVTDFLLPRHCISIVQNIFDAIGGPVMVRDGEHHVSCAAGLVIETLSRHSSPPTANLVERMIQLASRAMFEAKLKSRMSGSSEMILGRLGHDRVN